MEPTGQHGRVAKTSSTQANYRRHHRQYVENQERERESWLLNTTRKSIICRGLRYRLITVKD